jgi:hypothetical protein
VSHSSALPHLESYLQLAVAVGAEAQRKLSRLVTSSGFKCLANRCKFWMGMEPKASGDFVHEFHALQIDVYKIIKCVQD